MEGKRLHLLFNETGSINQHTEIHRMSAVNIQKQSLTESESHDF
jgi:hypothetical protein